MQEREDADRVVKIARAVGVRHDLRGSDGEVDRHVEVDDRAEDRGAGEWSRSEPPPTDMGAEPGHVVTSQVRRVRLVRLAGTRSCSWVTVSTTYSRTNCGSCG